LDLLRRDHPQALAPILRDCCRQNAVTDEKNTEGRQRFQELLTDPRRTGKSDHA
jgi:hypothetical protein